MQTMATSCHFHHLEVQLLPPLLLVPLPRNETLKARRRRVHRKDVIRIRAEGDRRRSKKSEMRKWVLSRIEEDKTSMEDIDDDDEDDEVMALPPWQEYTRSVCNNLNLEY